jgi:hypothetical protein
MKLISPHGMQFLPPNLMDGNKGTLLYSPPNIGQTKLKYQHRNEVLYWADLPDPHVCIGGDKSFSPGK